MFKLVLEKAEEPEIKLPNPLDHGKSKRVPENHIFLPFLAMPKPLTVWITINCGKFWKRWEYQTTWHASWETCMQVRNKQLELYLKWGKGVCRGCMLSPAYLTYLQSTSWEMLGWMKHKLESRMTGEISITSDMQMTPPLWQKAKRL